MAENAEAKEKNAAQEQKPQAKPEPEFALEKLRSNSMKLFGVTTSTFDGAMYGHEDKHYTVNQAKGIIEKWLKSKGGKH